MKKLLEKWREIINQDNTEHLAIPRGMLFIWGLFILIFQTATILFSFDLLLQISGALWVVIIFLSRQYYIVWKRYYSLVWPILVQTLSIIAAIYIKVRFL